MVFLTAVLFILAFVSLIFGFGGMEAKIAKPGRGLFVIFTILFVVSFLGNYLAWY